MTEIEIDPDEVLDPTRLTRLSVIPSDDPWYVEA